jgi:Holliday junction resolvase RusA-like endonuclease
MGELFPIRLTIMGPARVWKNSKGGFILPGGGKGQPCPHCKRKLIVTVQPSDAARRWMKEAIRQLELQWQYKPIPKTVALNAEIVTYLPTRRLPDASNLYQGPEDAMVAAGILEDDQCIASHNGSRRDYDKTNPRTEIILTRIEEADEVARLRAEVERLKKDRAHWRFRWEKADMSESILRLRLEELTGDDDAKERGGT